MAVHAAVDPADRERQAFAREVPGLVAVLLGVLAPDGLLDRLAAASAPASA